MYPYDQLPLAWLQAVCPTCGRLHPKRIEIESFTDRFPTDTLACVCGKTIEVGGAESVPVEIFSPRACNEEFPA